MLLTALVTGFSVSVVGVLPVAAALVPYKGTRISAASLSNSISMNGTKYHYFSRNKADTILLSKNGGTVPSKTIYFHYDLSGGNWKPALTKGLFYPDRGLNFGAKGYYWYRYSDDTFHYYKARPITQRFLKFEVQKDNNVAPVPIPGAALLLASGLLGLGWMNQRRAKARRG